MDERPADQAQAKRELSGWQLYLLVGWIASAVVIVLGQLLGLAMGLLLDRGPSDELLVGSALAVVFVSVIPAMRWARLSGWRSGLLAIVATVGLLLAESLLDDVTGIGTGWVVPAVIGWLVGARLLGWRPPPRAEGG